MYSTYFVNNKTYGADDINTVLARLTTQGVSLFKDTGNALTDIETAISSFVDTGVELYDTEGCKVVADSNGRYRISKGCCWMPTGACIVFDDSGYVFTPNFITESGAGASDCFIYLRQGGDASDEASNDINIIISPTKYSDEDVPLASISASGVITDRRNFAQAKVAVPTSNIIQEGSITLPENDEITIILPYAGFSHICMLNHTNDDNVSGGKPYPLSSEPTYIGGTGGISVHAAKSGNSVIFSSSASNMIGSDECDVKYMVF